MDGIERRPSGVYVARRWTPIPSWAALQAAALRRRFGTPPWAAWTAIPDKSTGDLMDETWYDTHFKANMEYLLGERPVLSAGQTTGTDYTVVGTTWTNVDAANLSVAITPASTRVMLFAAASLAADNTGGSAAEVRFNEATVGATPALARVAQNTQRWVAVMSVYTGLTPGVAHTFVLQYRNIQAGATTTLARNGYRSTVIGWEV